jgi:hypothetical protein
MIAQQMYSGSASASASPWRYDPLAVLSTRDRARLDGRGEGWACSQPGFDPQRGSFVSSDIAAGSNAASESRCSLCGCACACVFLAANSYTGLRGLSFSLPVPCCDVRDFLYVLLQMLPLRRSCPQRPAECRVSTGAVRSLRRSPT